MIAQSDFARRTNGGEPFTVGGQRLYATRDDFAKDAAQCLIGYMGEDKVLSPQEEIDIAWAVFNHAKRRDGFLILGRMEDRLHSGIIAEHGVTSEHFHGAVLNPEKWNAFINDVWVLGIIKAGKQVLTATDFIALTREASTFLP